jgi:hypothetical protein
MKLTALAPPDRWQQLVKVRRGILRHRLLLLMVCIILILAVQTDGYLGRARVSLAINEAISGDRFQLAAWEAQAINQKARDLVQRPGSELTSEEQSALVVKYISDIGRVNELNSQIERIFADPDVSDPTAAAQPLQEELTALRTKQEERRPAVEWIIERQVRAVLEDAGLTVLGGVLPPVLFQFTESPNYLIISPRERIMVESGVYLDPALPVSDMERIEGQLSAELNKSTLVDGTGGFSSYPTMVLAHPSLDWVIDTVAHEWTHTYLMFQPLGWNYYDNGAMRTINETVASIIGGEIADRVMARFYPDQVRPASWPRPLSMRRDWAGQADTAAEFEFGPFMRNTRLTVDRMLAEGKVEEAEAYMEAQRQVLIEQGYNIRKLNQAYFAFRGSYAVGPAATDPIGGKLRALLQRSPTLADFLATVARFDQPSDLDAALEN